MNGKGLINYFKGLAIGVCALVPGISGGTMALILGIYERLINSIASFSVKSFLLMFKPSKSTLEKKRVNSFKKNIDLSFVLTVVFGVLTMLFIGATGILNLLEVHYSYTISFFIGLIVASGFFIYKQVSDKSFKVVFPFTLIGILVGLSMFFIVPANLTNPPFWYLIFAGFFGVSALFLPGISGSLILLLLGVYQHMLEIVSNPIENFISVLGFGLGMVVGAISISKLISYLIKNYKSSLFCFLIGLIFGSLIIPIRSVLDFGISSYILAGLFFILGFFTIFIFERFSN